MSKTVQPIGARQVGELSRLLEERGIGGKEFQSLIEKPDSVVALIRGEYSSPVVANIYPVTVNYDQPVDKAIKAGHYDCHNDDISDKNFPTKRSGNVELDVELVHFGKNMSTDEVLAELDKRGLRPAELHELLALGAKFLDLQREFPIIALGSVWQYSYGFRNCPCLGRDGSERELRLHWIEGGWLDYCRFVAVRK